ncbi:uncharacterized protein LOC103718881 [Phoenix dactylifera]|uniref:Uncharacterized protein LOC103718881 n=1 Tax=Phoenix dactylifera TaxID=42345 RepID=A0A8B7CTJ8_PHODC|nr:uncharacterized protein LOC103718881 [Phoenix dactylifera]
MESFRHQRSPGSERFLGLFTPPDSNGSAGVELHEDEVFWTASDHPDPARTPRAANPNPNPSHGLLSSSSSRAALRRPLDRSFGILAALPEEDKNPSLATGGPPFLQRTPSLSSSSSASSSSAARMIPAIPKPKTEYSLSVPAGKIRHQSAPVNVPVVPRRLRKAVDELEGGGGNEDGDDDELLPPHEIVARRGSPTTTFSVLEGAGRTLKGRDLRQVRNAVWRKTGFLD